MLPWLLVGAPILISILAKATDTSTNLNTEIRGIRIEDVAEKVLSIFGEKGKEIGKTIDDKTKDVTIKF